MDAYYFYVEQQILAKHFLTSIRTMKIKQTKVAIFKNIKRPNNLLL